MSDIPTDRKYSKSHEWFLVTGDEVIVGITQFAADALTDVTFVDLPAVGTKVEAGKPFGEIESVKATSELFTFIAGEISAINESLNDSPELVNSDPYNDGWMVRIKASDKSALDSLMDADAYKQMASG